MYSHTVFRTTFLTTAIAKFYRGIIRKINYNESKNREGFLTLKKSRHSRLLAGLIKLMNTTWTRDNRNYFKTM